MRNSFFLISVDLSRGLDESLLFWIRFCFLDSNLVKSSLGFEELGARGAAAVFGLTLELGLYVSFYFFGGENLGLIALKSLSIYFIWRSTLPGLYGGDLIFLGVLFCY